MLMCQRIVALKYRPLATSIHFFTVTHNQRNHCRMPMKLRALTASMLHGLLQMGLILMLLGQLTLASDARASWLPDGPEVAMDSSKRDFGDVFAGEELEQNFPVRNVGDKPLELERRSTLGRRSTAPDYPVTAAVWHPNSLLRPRTAGARPAAPS